MILILEDNDDKIESIFQKYRSDIAGRQVLVCRTVEQAQQAMERLDREMWMLFIDNDLGYGGTGMEFLDWLAELTPSTIIEKIVITSLGLNIPKLMMSRCEKLNTLSEMMK